MKSPLTKKIGYNKGKSPNQIYLFTYNDITLNKMLPIMKQNLYIFSFIIDGVEDRFDENSDLSITYLGRVDTTRTSKIKAEEIFQISEQHYSRNTIGWHRMSDIIG